MKLSMAAGLGVILAATLAGRDAQALPIDRHHLAQGPFGLPSLRVLEEKLQLTHSQKEQILMLYNEYRHKSHGRHHLNIPTRTGSEGLQGSLRNELIAKIKALLNEKQRSIFDELIKHHHHPAKPKGSS